MRLFSELTLVIILIFWATSCITNHGVEMVDVDPKGWNQTIVINFENVDTLRTLDINVVLRYDRSIASNTLGISIETIVDDTLRIIEQMTLPVVATSSTADMQEYEAPYRSDVVLNKKGTYTFKITPINKSAGIRGVHAIGLEFL